MRVAYRVYRGQRRRDGRWHFRAGHVTEIRKHRGWYCAYRKAARTKRWFKCCCYRKVQGAVAQASRWYIATPLDGLDGWSDPSPETIKAMQVAPRYWLRWYSAKSIALVVAIGIAAYYAGKEATRNI